LTTSPANPVIGSENIGSLCVTPVSAHSVFVSVAIKDVQLPLYPGWTTTGVGNRWVIVANEPLLEAGMNGPGQRTATLYGKPNTSYRINESSNLSVATSSWPPAWTNFVPASLYVTTLVQGSLSNSPTLFLNAKEQ
jgi:hypothetical protein